MKSPNRSASLSGVQSWSTTAGQSAQPPRTNRRPTWLEIPIEKRLHVEVAWTEIGDRQTPCGQDTPLERPEVSRGDGPENSGQLVETVAGQRAERVEGVQHRALSVCSALTRRFRASPERPRRVGEDPRKFTQEVPGPATHSRSVVVQLRRNWWPALTQFLATNSGGAPRHFWRIF